MYQITFKTALNQNEQFVEISAAAECSYAQNQILHAAVKLEIYLGYRNETHFAIILSLVSYCLRMNDWVAKNEKRLMTTEDSPAYIMISRHFLMSCNLDTYSLR